ncbi:hypothetical protein [Maribacter sp. 2210JD10-5]|uniref:hypothetical protein n=1 Tax=Maribacter sp. 2210JD10-5 TaxID=3386272 RepID=UPI0039BD4338
MKKLLKILGVILGLLLLFLIGLGIYLHEPLPEGKFGPKADALAEKMMKSLNYETYRNTQFLEWSYRGGANDYKWDKHNQTVEIRWDNYFVSLDLINIESSKSFENEERLTGSENESVIGKALKSFYNDSFWLVAPYKVMDKGTKLSIVILEDGSEALLVTYMEGGSTPGDSYLWLLQPNGFPKSFKMWVSIIPVGGLEATWDDWAVMESGCFLPKSHVFGPLELSMGNVRGYNR